MELLNYLTWRLKGLHHLRLFLHLPSCHCWEDTFVRRICPRLSIIDVGYFAIGRNPVSSIGNHWGVFSRIFNETKNRPLYFVDKYNDQKVDNKN
jgi:hypothetical protein